MPCVELTKETDECAKEEDHGYSECSKKEDQGYETCDKWADHGHSECCDWAPCSWFCDAFYWVAKWVCVAYVWISNMVCVAWTWVSKWVCVAWKTITWTVCHVVDAIVTVIGAIVTTLESILGWVLSALAFVIELIMSIPILGAIIRQIWNIILTIVWGIVGLVEIGLTLLGIMPEKKLRLCVIYLNRGRGMSAAEEREIIVGIQHAIDVYRDQANVRVINLHPFHYDSGFAKAETADKHWIHVHPDKDSAPDSALDVRCGADGWTEDFGWAGSYYELTASTVCFFGNWRRLTGYGSPIAVFAVRSISGKEGCSMGPLTDYVTVEVTPEDLNGAHSIAHECGHACNLWHHSATGNLMTPGQDLAGTKLKRWQIAMIRASRHVSYL